MQDHRRTIKEYESLGMERIQELIELGSYSPEESLSRLEKLSWIRVKEVIDHPLADRSGFHLPILFFVDLLKEVVLNQRGPGVLGYIRQLEFSFSPRVNASYQPHSRIIRLNLGLTLYVNELEATYRWFDSLFLTGAVTMSLDEITRLAAPPDVEDELAALLQIGEEQLPVSGEKFGLGHPIGRMLIRFLMAHELAHLIDSAESPELQAFWRQSAWSDYEDALGYCLSVGQVDRARYDRFRRSSLAEYVISQWGNEFVADSLAFYTVSKTPPETVSYMPTNRGLPTFIERHIEPQLAYPMLQTAVEIFFFSLIAAYRGDISTDSHPSPSLRRDVIRASQRKFHGVSWPEFLADYWGSGIITDHLLTTTVRKIRRER